MSTATIIAAAGSGSRLGQAKQFLELAPGERLIDRTVAVARATTDWVGVVVPPGHEWTGSPVDAVIEGGDSRYESVSAGLQALPGGTTRVVIHSASHPLASAELVGALLAALDDGSDGSVPFLEAVDVLKRQDDGRLVTVGREGFGAAQCPMAFRREALDRAYAEITTGTEDSQMVEAAGGRVVAVPGEVTNLHVVDEASLAAVRALAPGTRPD